MKKSIYTFLIALVFILSIPQVGHAAEAVPLFLNGKKIVSTIPAQNIKGTTMVPVRVISEEMGATVGWNDKDKRVTVTKTSSLNIQMQLNKKAVTVNGQVSQLSAAPVNVKGTTLLPLRFLAESLGLKVVWNEKDRSVNLAPAVTVVPVIAPPIDTAGKPNPVVIEVLPQIQSIQTANDQIIIQSNGDLKPIMSYMDAPNRLVIDFPNSALSDILKANINKTILSSDIAGSLINTADNLVSSAAAAESSVTSSTYIDKIRYALYSDKPSTVRVAVDLKQKTPFQLTEDKANHQVIISIKKAPFIVVIDPGHGAKDNGATSITKKFEKNFNLSMGLKVQKLLADEPLIQVVMTRSDDTFIELDERAAIANRLNASLFVSIHGNAYVKATSGVETYYERAESLALAQTMHPLVANATGFKNNGIKQNNFRVITKTTMPAILLELGYLTNANDEAQMYTDAFQDRVAASIALGIKQYLQIK